MDSVGKKKSQIHSWENDANYFLLIKAVLGFRLAILQIKDWHINANIMLRVFSKGLISNGNKLVSCYFKCLKLSGYYLTLIYTEKYIYISVLTPTSDMEVEYSSFCTVAVLLWEWRSFKSFGAERSKAKKNWMTVGFLKYHRN